MIEYSPPQSKYFQLFSRVAPIFEGLGYGMIFVRSCVNIYYVVICAWAFFYLFAGMTSELPWGTCQEEWNTYDCYTLKYEQVKISR